MNDRPTGALGLPPSKTGVSAAASSAVFYRREIAAPEGLPCDGLGQ